MSFYNISNHPSKNWGKAQLEAAKKLGNGEVIDIAFPNVNPNLTSAEVAGLATATLKDVEINNNSVVMIQGEAALTFVMTLVAYQRHLRAVVATTERVVTETLTDEGAVKTATFEFKGFRDVHACAQWVIVSMISAGL